MRSRWTWKCGSARAVEIGDGGLGFAVRPLTSESHREHADVAMPEPDDVLRDAAHRGAIVDAHQRSAGHVLWLIDDDDRECALREHLQIGIVVGGRIDDEPVDTRRQHRRRAIAHAAIRTCRDQQ